MKNTTPRALEARHFAPWAENIGQLSSAWLRIMHRPGSSACCPAVTVDRVNHVDAAPRKIR